jgi:hypothetical protein
MRSITRPTSLVNSNVSALSKVVAVASGLTVLFKNPFLSLPIEKGTTSVRTCWYLRDNEGINAVVVAHGDDDDPVAAASSAAEIAAVENFMAEDEIVKSQIKSRFCGFDWWRLVVTRGRARLACRLLSSGVKFFGYIPRMYKVKCTQIFNKIVFTTQRKTE